MIKPYFTVFIIATVVTIGCKKQDDVTASNTQSTAIPADKIRLVVAVPTSIKDTDKLTLAGNFPNEAWDPKKSAKYELKRNSPIEYTLDVALSDLPKTGNLEYKVVRNAMASDNSDGWKYVEKTTDCKELSGNRVVTTPATAGGKSFAVKVDNFRNTGTCGD